MKKLANSLNKISKRTFSFTLALCFLLLLLPALPAQAAGYTPVYNIVAGGDSQSLAIGNSGILYAWGGGGQGQLGNGSTTGSQPSITVVKAAYSNDTT